MSQHPYQVMIAPRPTNALGVAGFVCSLVGLVFTGGLLCPVGLVLSLIGLGREPRGFAVAGLILGLVGTCGWALVFILLGGVILASLGLAVAAIALSEPEKLEITSDMANAALAVKVYESENDYLPAELTNLDLRPAMLVDPWGTPYAYHLIEERPGFDIVSAGADGQFGTADDVHLTALGKAWEPGGFGVEVEEMDDGGRVRIKLGERSITAGGTDDRGEVTIDLGDRVIEIVGDDEGGHVTERSDEGEEKETPATRPDEGSPPGGSGGSGS